MPRQQTTISKRKIEQSATITTIKTTAIKYIIIIAIVVVIIITIMYYVINITAVVINYDYCG